MKSLHPLTLLLMASLALATTCQGLILSNQNPTKTRPLPLSSLLAPSQPPTQPNTLIRPSISTRTSTTTALLESVNNGGGSGGGTGSISSYDKVDWTALIKYPVGVAVQMSLIFGFLTGVDKLVAHFSLKVPFAVNFLFLYAFSIKSSLFSILPSKKSGTKEQKQEDWEYNQRNKPSWTPPGIAFAIGWPLLTFGCRAFAGAMVVQAMGGIYATPAIMSLMFHFCIGTLWNTVNNVERRLGVSVILLYGLWLSKAFAAFQFYKVTPLAGKLMAATLTWITAACALETRTWQINPDPDTNKLEPLLPMQHPKWSTKFRWEQ